MPTDEMTIAWPGEASVVQTPGRAVDALEERDLIEKMRTLAEVHLEDHDCLGEAARVVLRAIGTEDGREIT